MRPLALTLVALFAACDSAQPPVQEPPPPSCQGKLGGAALDGCYVSAAVSPTTGASFLRITKPAGAALDGELDLDDRLTPGTFGDGNARSLTLSSGSFHAVAGTSVAAGDHRGAITIAISAVGLADGYGVLSSVDGTLTATLVADDPNATPIQATLSF
jgi:hypothetical protein